MTRASRRMMGPDGELDDVVHDIFVRALESLPRLRDPSALKSWLFGITVRTVRIRFQKRTRQRWLRFVAPEHVPEQASVPVTELGGDSDGGLTANGTPVLGDLRTRHPMRASCLRRLTGPALRHPGPCALTPPLSGATTKAAPRSWPESLTRSTKGGMSPLDRAVANLQPLRGRLLAHPLYAAIDSPGALRVFMEHHAFAVWDFMSLVKAVQRQLTCLDVPWTPRGERRSRRFINEIVLGEESDDDGAGGFTSHFELYLDAMRQAGARTDRIEAFLDLLGHGETVDEALDHADAPLAARAFVRSTFRVIASGSLAAVGAAFTLGREDVIPDMFRALVVRLDDASPGHFGHLRRYLERHVDVDENRHAPMARALLETLCGDEPAHWSDAEAAAKQALEARLALWDGVLIIADQASV